MKLNNLFPILLLFFLIMPCSAVTITTNVSINLTNTSISFDENFTFDQVVVDTDTLSMYNGSYSWCNFSVIPTNDVIINISTWNCTGDYRKTFNETASAGTVTEHIITGYPSGSVNVYKNSVINDNVNVDSFGIIDWMYSDGYSTHLFDLIYSNLTASFSVNKRSGVNPLDVYFTDLSTGNPTSWYWTFGDGETSIAQNPYHTYDEEGTYTVTLNVSHVNGFDTENKTNYITVDSRYSGSSDIATRTVPTILLVVVILFSCLGIAALRGAEVSEELVKYVIGLLVIMIMVYLIYGIASLMEETFSILH